MTLKTCSDPAAIKRKQQGLQKTQLQAECIYFPNILFIRSLTDEIKTEPCNNIFRNEFISVISLDLQNCVKFSFVFVFFHCFPFCRYLDDLGQ